MNRTTDKEKTLRGLLEFGFEVSEIGNTLQYTMTNGKLCIQYFTTNGSWIKTEWV